MLPLPLPLHARTLLFLPELSSSLGIIVEDDDDYICEVEIVLRCAICIGNPESRLIAGGPTEEDLAVQYDRRIFVIQILAPFYTLYFSLLSVPLRLPVSFIPSLYFSLSPPISLSLSTNAAFMVIDISEQILWFRRVTHEDCAHGWTDGARGLRLRASERASGKGGGGGEGMAHFKRTVQRTEKCGLFHRALHQSLFRRVFLRR